MVAAVPLLLQNSEVRGPDPGEVIGRGSSAYSPAYDHDSCISDAHQTYITLSDNRVTQKGGPAGAGESCVSLSVAGREGPVSADCDHDFAGTGPGLKMRVRLAYLADLFDNGIFHGNSPNNSSGEHTQAGR